MDYAEKSEDELEEREEGQTMNYVKPGYMDPLLRRNISNNLTTCELVLQKGILSAWYVSHMKNNSS